MNTLKAVKAAKLHINQALTLGYLLETPGLKPGEIQAKIGGSRNLASQLLKVLLQRGYIRVESVKTDVGLRQFHPHYFLEPKGLKIASQFTYDETKSNIPH